MKTVLALGRLWGLSAAFLIACMIAGTGLAATARAQSAADGYIVTRDTPSWFKSSFLDFGEDIAEASEEGKRVMIYFGQDNCPYCKRLHETSFKDAEITAYLRKHFHSIAVNIFGDLDTTWTDGASGSEKEFARRLGIQFTPTLLFLDEKGDTVIRIDGYRPPKWMRTALKYAAGGNNPEGLPFDIYMHENTESGTKNAATPKLPDKFNPPNGGLHAPKRRTLVFVSSADCAPCGEWRDYLGKHAEKWRDSFQLVALDLFGKTPATDAKNESEWAHDMKIAYTPALIFLNPDGTEFFRAEGYFRAFHLNTVLEYVKAGGTKANPEFQRFLQNYSDRLRESGQPVSVW